MRFLPLALLIACTKDPAGDTDTDTDAPVDTDTSEGADVFAAGTLVIEPLYAADLETGAAAEGAIVDLWWEHQDTTVRYLRPVGFTRLAAVAAEPAGPVACGASALAFDAIDGSGAAYGDLAVGTWLCVHTTEGHVGALNVTAMTPSGEAQLPAITLDYVLWEPATIPDPVLREPVAELAPWLDVRFGWQTDFADGCEVAWYKPEQTVAERVDTDLSADAYLDDVASPPLRWDESWGNEIRAVLTCSRTSTGQFAEHTFDLTRPTPSAPAPVITAFTGEAVPTGNPDDPWLAHLIWTTTDADSCHLWWFNPDDNDHFNDEDGFPASNDVNVLYRADYAGAGFDLKCTQAATGRSDMKTITLTHP